MRRSLLWPIYAALTAIVLAPLCSVQVPALGDTLNHLARMHVLTHIDTSPALQRFYAVHWAPIPYLAMDAIVPILARVMPIYLAGKLFVLACVLMPVLGIASLHFAVHRRWSLVPAAGFLLSYNYLLATGFLNYLFSLGCAVLLFALWVASAGRPRWWRLAVFSPFVLLLYFGHAFACFGYCLSVAGFELSRAVRARFVPPAAVAADVCMAGAQALPALWFAATLDVSAGYVGALHTQYGNLGAKITALISPFLFLTDGHGALLVLATLLLFGAVAKWVVMAPSIWPAALAVGLVAVAMPDLLLSTWGLDLRFPLFTAMLLLGGASFRPLPAWAKPMAVTALLGVVTLKAIFANQSLHKLDQDVTQTRGILAALPVGSRLLVVDVAGIHPKQAKLPANTLWNLPMLAVIDRDAFVPYFFNGLTTVRIQPGTLLSSTPNGFPLTPAQLSANLTTTDLGTAQIPDTGLGGGALYWRGWPKKFDYVLVERFGLDPGTLPGNLVSVAHSADLDLYRVSSAEAQP
jgi:hypothetical protein